MILRLVRVGAVVSVLVAAAVASDCGGSPFTAGGGADASVDSSSGGSGGSSSGSSSGGVADAPSCAPPMTNNPACDDCLATNCDAEWCVCSQDTACETYIGCLLRGNTPITCASACGCSTDSISRGNRLIGCSALHCKNECASGTSSGSSSGGSGSGSSSGVSSSSSGGSSSSSGGSSSSSGGSSSSSGGGSSSSSGGILPDGGCVCPQCGGSSVCCTIAGATNYCKCYDPTCMACCMP